MLRKIAVSFLVVAVFACFNSATAQINLGVKGGINLSHLWGAEEEGGVDPYEHQVMLPGAVAGVYAEIVAAPMFAIQPEVLFSMKGTKVSDDDESVLRANYLEIPLLLKLRIPVGPVTPSVYTGVAAGFLLGVGGYEEFNGERHDFTDEDKEEIKDMMKSFDLGLPMGVALDIDVGPISIVADVRYTLGLTIIPELTDDMKDLGVTEDDLGDHRNGALSIMAGIAIPFGM